MHVLHYFDPNSYTRMLTKEIKYKPHSREENITAVGNAPPLLRNCVHSTLKGVHIYLNPARPNTYCVPKLTLRAVPAVHAIPNPSLPALDAGNGLCE